MGIHSETVTDDHGTPTAQHEPVHEQLLKAIGATTKDAIIMLDSDGKVTFWNLAAEQIFGYTSAEVHGACLSDLIVPERYRQAHNQGIANVLPADGEAKISRIIELEAHAKDGNEFPAELTLTPVELAGQLSTIGIVRDLSEHLRAEAEHQKINKLLRILSSCVRALNQETDEAQLLATVAEDIIATGGYPMAWIALTEQIIGQPPATAMEEDGNDPRAAATHNNNGVDEQSTSIALEQTTAAQVIRTGEAILERDLKTQNLTDPRHREALQRNCQAAITIPLQTTRKPSKNDTDGILGVLTIYTKERSGFFASEVRLLREIADEISCVMTDLRAGATGQQARVKLALQEARMRSIIEKQTDGVLVVDDGGRVLFSNNAAEQMIGRSWEDLCSQPLGVPLLAGELTELTLLHRNKKRVSVEMRVIETKWDDVSANLVALHDITAIKHLVAERQVSADKLKTVLTDTIGATIKAFEKRDPYTAGHQRRVAQLSVAIATKMGLDQDQIDGIELGATIHDIGKIYVPAEILSRPGKLTTAEFEIIKSHATVGYEIMLGVDFPWPVCEIIHQHHERLDGSGYPQGLRGDEIVLEARIVCIADVIEAMATHRPYRPGWGIDAALEEIINKRGTFFDPEIVDICVQLFNNEEFSLE